MMYRLPLIAIAIGALAITLSGASVGRAATGSSMSDADKAFVAKVSQGGMYEVELGKLAEKQGATQDIRDQGNTENHDHELVGGKLKSIVEAGGGTFPTELNSEFKARLAKIAAMNGAAFDQAYLEDMRKIHAADGAAFLKESKDGSNPDLKAFAAETYNIVQRHIGELDAHTRPKPMTK